MVFSHLVVMLIMTNSSSFWLTSSSSVRIDVAFTAALCRPIDDMPVLPKPSVKNTFLNFDVESFPGSVRTRCHTLPAVLRENNVLKQQPRISNKIESHFTLRRADGVQLGVEWLADFDQSLSVLRVLNGGALHAWNRTCSDDSRKVMVGDKIVRINDACTPSAMRLESDQKLLLRISLVHVRECQVCDTSPAAQVRSLCLAPPNMSMIWIPVVASRWPWLQSAVEVFSSEVPVASRSRKWIEENSTVSGTSSPKASSLASDVGPIVRDSSSQSISSDDLSMDAELANDIAGSNFVVDWVLEARLFTRAFTNKKTQLTKMHTEGNERFTFIIYLIRTSCGQGGHCFSAAQMQGRLEVKCNSETPSCVLQAVSVGEDGIQDFSHNFDKNGRMFRMPGMTRFLDACDDGSNSVTIRFYFDKVHP